MTLPTWYSTGTVSVENGSTAVTLTGGFWGDDNIMPGDLFCDPAQPLVPPQRIASVAYDDVDEVWTAELWADWPGTTMEDADYEVRYVGIIERSTAQTRRVLERLGVVQANGRGLFYRFSDTTADGDPGSGYLRLDNGDPSLATEIYIDNLDANGGTVAAVIDTWDDSSSLDKGKLWLRSIADPSAFRAYRVAGAVVDGTGYRKLAVEHVGGSGSFAADDEIMVAFAEKGDVGDSFTYDELVADPSELVALEGEDTGYLVFVTDLETEFGAYAGRSGVVRLIAGPDWELVALYSGPKGDKGDTGEKGWTPQMVIASDGARRVWQLDGYVGGAGDAPTANVGQYLKADGTWTSTIGDAADVRGPAGADGELSGDLGATDDAILRANGTGGTTAQGSTATLTDAGLMSTAGFVSTRAKSDTEGPGSNAGEFVGKDSLWATRTGTDDSFNLDIYSGGNALKIKPGAQVLKPKTPRFNAVLNSNFTPNLSALTAFGGAWSSTVRVNVGSHFVPATGRFTAPVAGDYRFSVTAAGYLAASGLQLWLYRNGSSISGGGCYMEVANGVWTTAGMEILISLSASDYVELYGYSYNAGNYLSAAYTNFIGELVG
jgi:hypothetical protein